MSRTRMRGVKDAPLGNPPLPDPHVGARLLFHGILPAFEDFLKFDPVARRILGKACFSVLFRNRTDMRAILRFSGGRAIWSESSEEPADLIVDLGSEENTVRFIRGGLALPRLRRGYARPVAVIRLMRLFLRFHQLLKPKPKALEDPAFRMMHVRLALAAALFSVGEIGRSDPWARRVLGDLPEGMVRFRVKGGDLQARMEHRNGFLKPFRGFDGGEEADVEIEFGEPKTAMEILTQKRDSHEALAMGDLRVTGCVPLADGIGHILDRVALYLPA